MSGVIFWSMLALILSSATHGHAGGGRFSEDDYARYFPDSACAPEAFALAVRGYRILADEEVVENSRYLTVVDFSKPSHLPRLFVLDAQRRAVVLRSHVSHGLGSDPDSTTIPYRFSNRNGSRMTSAGFYLTGATYYNFRPRDSTGLCLFGLDRDYNDSAAAREIVVHYGATETRGTVYVTDTGAGRSYGCPALPLSTNKRFIETVKGGSVLFIYSPRVPGYAEASSVLNRRLRWPLRQEGPAPNRCTCTVAPGRTEYRAEQR